MAHKWMAWHDASIVDNYVNVGYSVFHFLGSGLYILLIRDVTVKCISLTSALFDLTGSFLCSFQVDVPADNNTA